MALQEPGTGSPRIADLRWEVLEAARARDWPRWARAYHRAFGVRAPGIGLSNSRSRATGDTQESR